MVILIIFLVVIGVILSGSFLEIVFGIGVEIEIRVIKLNIEIGIKVIKLNIEIRLNIKIEFKN